MYIVRHSQWWSIWSMWSMMVNVVKLCNFMWFMQLKPSKLFHHFTLKIFLGDVAILGKMNNTSTFTIYTHKYIYICTRAHTHTCAHTHTFAWTQIYEHMQAHTSVHAHIHKDNINAHIHIDQKIIVKGLACETKTFVLTFL